MSEEQYNPEEMEPSSVICGVMTGDPRAWVPMEDHEAMRRKMTRFKTALHEIVGVLDKLTDAEQQDILQPLAVAPKEGETL